MKKLAFSLLLTLTFFVFTSCKNDGSIKLSGTSWTATITSDGTTVNQTINFTDSKNVKIISQIASVSYTETGTYTYTHPTIIIKFDDGGDDIAELTVADSEHITMTNEGGLIITYTKK